MNAFRIDAEAGRLVICGELTIYQAAEAKEAFLAARAAGCCTADLGGITELDTAGLQLLIAGKAAGMALVNASDAAQEVFDLLNLPLQEADLTV